MNPKSKSDIIAAIFLIFLSMIFFWNSRGFPDSKREIGVGAFPRLLAGLLIILSIVLIINAIKNFTLSKSPPLFKEFTKGHKFILVVIAALLIYIRILEPLGFILSSFLLLLTLMFIFGEKRKMILLFVPIGFSIILYIVFAKLAMVSLPEGIIENFFF
ncbi:MAG: tripartite tricarboxylate transporter TctB family protein [Candidatus Atribacteria bacterium]|nr:tripartite tricarboxylate transporter TctB family protein [Candidatus Atribacteria bacterium]